MQSNSARQATAPMLPVLLLLQPTITLVSTLSRTEKGHLPPDASFLGLFVSLSAPSDTSLLCWALKPKGQPLMLPVCQWGVFVNACARSQALQCRNERALLFFAGSDQRAQVYSV